MLKHQNKLQLTKKERIALEFIMLSPIPIVIVMLHYFNFFLGTLAAFHVVLITLPIIFLKYKGVKINWIEIIKQDLTKHTRNLNRDLIIAGIPSAVVTTAYIIYRNVFPDYDYSRLRLPSPDDFAAAIIMTLQFIFINPILEELFWRVFCDAFTGQGRTIKQKLDVAVHFAAYHFFVIIYLTKEDYVLCTVGFFVIVAMGYIFTCMKQKFGLITTTIIHIGIDLAAAIVVVDMVAKYMPFY